MTPGVRKLALTAHVTSSIGWLGAVATFLALAIAGLASSNAALVRASYLAMEFAITVLASVLLLVHMQVANRMATVAAETVLGGDFRGLRIQLIADAAAAVVVLLIATALSVYKPRGLPPFGRKQEDVTLGHPGAVNETHWRLAFGLVLGALIVFVLIKHLSGGGLYHH